MKKSYWLQAVTPLHSGVGRGLGYIDTPIARETVTNWPYVPASSVKGVLRDYYLDNDETKNLVKKAFGDADDNCAGALVFTDAKLVCLPIRSLYGTFAWCCSKISLKRIKRDLDLAQIETKGLDKINDLQDLNPQEVMVTSTTKLENEKKVYLEDLDLKVSNVSADSIADYLAEKIFTNKEDKDMFKERFAIVSEDVFNFLCETGTEVIAHNKIDDETKVTVKGALWYEETLPAETILFGFVWQQLTVKDKDKNEISLENTFCKSDKPVNLQLGGKSSVGKGQIICNFVKEN